jgi:hypothetical protein
MDFNSILSSIMSLGKHTPQVQLTKADNPVAKPNLQQSVPFQTTSPNMISPLSGMGQFNQNQEMNMNIIKENAQKMQAYEQAVKGRPIPQQMQQAAPMPQGNTQGATSFADIITPKNPQFTDRYSNNTYNIVPELFDAIMKANIPVEQDEQAYGMPMSDYMRRLALSLGAGESTGGRNLRGDTNLPEAEQAYGGFHIRPGARKDISIDEAMDFDKAAQYVIDEMMYNKNKGVEPKQFLRGGQGNKNWNYWSGYAGEGEPGYGGMTYDDDLVRNATTSSFLRKR